jgi:hypothetical protein
MAICSENSVYLDVITLMISGGVQFVTFLTMQLSSSLRLHVGRHCNEEPSAITMFPVAAESLASLTEISYRATGTCCHTLLTLVGSDWHL